MLWRVSFVGVCISAFLGGCRTGRTIDPERMDLAASLTDAVVCLRWPLGGPHRRRPDEVAPWTGDPRYLAAATGHADSQAPTPETDGAGGDDAEADLGFFGVPAPPRRGPPSPQRTIQDLRKYLRQSLLGEGRANASFTVASLVKKKLPPIRRAAATVVACAVRQGQCPMTLDALRKLCPKMSPTAIVKALGRVEPPRDDFRGPVCPTRPDAIRAFLIRCLADRRLAHSARLAAASGLTRDVHDQALAALAAHRRELDGIPGQAGLGSRLVESLRARKAFRDLAGPIVQSQRSSGFFDTDDDRLERTAKTLANALKAYYATGLMTVEDLLGSAAFAVPDTWPAESGRAVPPEQRDWTEAIVQAAGRIAADAQPWNTYSNAARLLDYHLRWVECTDSTFRVNNSLLDPPALRRRLREQIAPFLKASPPGERRKR